MLTTLFVFAVLFLPLSLSISLYFPHPIRISYKTRLASLLNDEENQFRAEIAAMQETVADKAARMQARARALKQAKEARRKQEVDDLYYQKWKNECDDIRGVDSRVKLEKTIEDRDAQRAQKARIVQEHQESEAAWRNHWEKGGIEKLARPNPSSEEVRQAKQEFNSSLQTQISSVNARRADEQARRQAEIQHFVRFIRFCIWPFLFSVDCCSLFILFYFSGPFHCTQILFRLFRTLSFRYTLSTLLIAPPLFFIIFSFFLFFPSFFHILSSYPLFSPPPLTHTNSVNSRRKMRSSWSNSAANSKKRMHVVSRRSKISTT